MEWTEDYESGLADIDVQHRYIFSLIERVSQLDDKVDRTELREVSEELGRLAICHFGCEERLMFSYGYPEAARHIAEHEKLSSEVRNFQHDDDFQPRQMALFLCNWLVSHTMLEDRQLAIHVLKVRAKAMGMSVSEFVESVKLYRPPISYLASRISERKVAGD